MVLEKNTKLLHSETEADHNEALLCSLCFYMYLMESTSTGSSLVESLNIYKTSQPCRTLLDSCPPPASPPPGIYSIATFTAIFPILLHNNPQLFRPMACCVFLTGGKTLWVHSLTLFACFILAHYFVDFFAETVWQISMLIHDIVLTFLPRHLL